MRRLRVAFVLASCVATLAAAADLLPAGKVFRDCGDCPEMVVVPKGEFTMGRAGFEAEELPVHRVRIGRPFALGRHEVTWADWGRCVAAGACPGLSDQGWGRGDRPVINVSWRQARTYVAWLARETGKRYRLPSEAEWEYAARSRSDGLRHWGDDAAAACRYANVANPSGRLKDGFLGDSFACEDGFDETAPAGSFEPNAFGLFDMLGNVWEWTDDCYHDSYVGAPADGRARATADCSRRVYRGGSWVSVPDLLRSSVRAMAGPDQHGPNVGFRVLREIR